MINLVGSFHFFVTDFPNVSCDECHMLIASYKITVLLEIRAQVVVLSGLYWDVVHEVPLCIGSSLLGAGIRSSELH